MKKKGPVARLSEAKGKASSSAGRKSVSKEASPPPSSAGKRGRGRARKTASSGAISDDEPEVDQLEDDDEDAPRHTTKKKRTSTAGAKQVVGENGHAGGKGKRKSLTALGRDTDGDGDVAMGDGSAEPENQQFTTMNSTRYKTEKSWEDVVKNISTVERVGDNLVVYFELESGELIRESSKLCAQRFPMKLIEFYESHLRWRMAD